MITAEELETLSTRAKGMLLFLSRRASPVDDFGNWLDVLPIKKFGQEALDDLVRLGAVTHGLRMIDMQFQSLPTNFAEVLRRSAGSN